MTLTEYLFLVPIGALALGGVAMWYADYSSRRLEEEYRKRRQSQ